MNEQHFLKNKNVLVTGGSGFVGSNLIKKLSLLNANICASYHNKKPVSILNNVDYVECDLLDESACREIVKNIDYVFHCASVTSSAGINSLDPDIFFTPNIQINMNILNSCSKAKVKKILFISSTTAYPNSEDSFLKEEDFFINDPFEKYFSLGWMYRMSEILCRMYFQSGEYPTIPVVLRPSNIYGEGDNFELNKSHAIPSLIRKVLECNSYLEVWGDGKDIRDFIYIDDFINAAILAMKKIETYVPLNIGLGKGYSIEKIVNLIFKIQGLVNIKIQYNLSKPSMIPTRLIDISKAKRVIGFTPSVDIELGLRKTIEWYKKETNHS